jgi:hypothetical protein
MKKNMELERGRTEWRVRKDGKKWKSGLRTELEVPDFPMGDLS